jgi:hypothetical protein
MTIELNNAYANWKASGGMVNSNATTSDLLYVLGTPTPADGSPRESSTGSVYDEDMSNMISVSLPPGLSTLQLKTANLQTVTSTEYSIYSNYAGSGSTDPNSDPGFLVTPLGSSPPVNWTLEFHMPAGELCWAAPLPASPCGPLSFDGFLFILPGGMPTTSGDIYGSSGTKQVKIHYSLEPNNNGFGLATWEIWAYEAPQ